MNADQRAAYIEALVDQAPPLTTEQQSRLRLLLQAPQTRKAGPASPATATDVHSPQEDRSDGKPARAA